MKKQCSNTKQTQKRQCKEKKSSNSLKKKLLKGTAQNIITEEIDTQYDYAGDSKEIQMGPIIKSVSTQTPQKHTRDIGTQVDKGCQTENMSYQQQFCTMVELPNNCKNTP